LIFEVIDVHRRRRKTGDHARMSTPPPLPPNSPAARPAPGWMQRNWKWAVPVMAVCATAIVAALIAGLLFGVRSMMLGSEPYQVALREAQLDPKLSKRLGSPIEPGFMPTGSIHTSGGSGEAALQIALSGPKGEATLFVDARRQAGEWRYRSLRVAFADGSEPLDLLPLEP
jgi:hypothetical protein